MKKILFLLFAASLLQACNTTETDGKSVQEIKASTVGVSNSDIIRNPVSANTPLDTVNVAKFDFEETVFDFGTTIEGHPVKHSYKFKNVGKVPLVISDARSTCGCTVPKWPEDPIAPGESGQIDIVFNTVRKLNEQEKPITITANTYPAKTVLKVKGYVHPAKVDPITKKPRETTTKQK